MKAKNILLICLLSSFISTAHAQIFSNSDFELGLTTGCHCPTGYTCTNDAGRVVDGIHPLFTVGDKGCALGDTTNYANAIGAYNGTGYVYFYASGDQINTASANFIEGEQIELCVWYAGPQGQGASGQNTDNAHFSFGVNGNPVGQDVLVPVGTTWTQYCFTVIMSAGNHNFNILSGGSAQYSMWFDNFTVAKSCPLPTVNLGNDTTLCQGETMLLDATTLNATYLWQNNSTTPTFSVTQQGTYWVDVTVNNCTLTSTILIHEEVCEIILELPNIFTPNNDGANDLFVPIISKGIVSMSTIIYNRWGSKVFETKNLAIKWDGQGVAEGTYFWIVYYTDINGVKNNLNGYLTLLK